MEIKGVKIEFLGHSGFLITCPQGKIIAIDPYNVSEHVPKSDLILITHSHHDHCSIKDITKLSRAGTTILIPADAQSKITKIDNVKMEIIEPGEEITLGSTRIEAIPAYNSQKEFHQKKDGWMGYLIKLNGLIIYHAGDTDKIPEMEKLTGYSKHENELIALLPVSGKFTMTAKEASEAAALIGADLAIPMHYGAGVIGTIEDAEKFVKLCEGKNIKAEILEKI